MADKKKLKPGDRVSWTSHGVRTPGRVEEEIDERTESAGRVVAASEQAPQYRVRSAKGGGDAVHKPEALRRER
jgi:hypothetical protein